MLDKKALKDYFQHNYDYISGYIVKYLKNIYIKT